jgi:lipocalin-like protein
MKSAQSCLLLASIACVALSGYASAQSAKPKIQPLAGAWTVVSVVQTNPDGSKVDVFGKTPLGGFLVTPGGQCSIIFMRDDLPKFKSGARPTGTAEEFTAVGKGSLAYSGDCSADGQDLTMKVNASTFPAWVGQTQKRKYTLEAEQLKWVGITGLQGTNVAVTLKRAK